MGNRCSTRYPILMVHGLGFRDWKYINYWGRIPKALKGQGASVFFGNQDSWGSIEENAITLRRTVLRILNETGAEKVNIIAHSKGGLDARYMISSLGMGDKVASLTTVSTPHHGSETMDILRRLPLWMFKAVGWFVNLYYRILGDKSPNFVRASKQLSTETCRRFNRDNPDCKGVYYQSYAVAMKNPMSDIVMFIPNLVIGIAEGENDGIVAVSSAVWGDFRGVVRSSTRRGVSHPDIVDFRRRKCGDFDPREFYIGIAEQLKNKGF